MAAPLPYSGVPRRYQTATVLQILAPLSWGFGLWLIFPSLRISGGACVTCFSLIGVGIDTTPSALIQTAIGALLFIAGLLLFASSLGILASNNNIQAYIWLHWLGRWRPVWRDQSQGPVGPQNHRSLVLASLSVNLIFAILVIPGIGEERQFPLDQFFDLWGTIFYFYVFTIGVFGLMLIYKRKLGGYFLSLILGLIAVGMVVPDLLGLLPPRPPTFRTSIIMASQLPVSVLCSYASWKALRTIAVTS